MNDTITNSELIVDSGDLLVSEEAVSTGGVKISNTTGAIKVIKQNDNEELLEGAEFELWVGSTEETATLIKSSLFLLNSCKSFKVDKILFGLS